MRLMISANQKLSFKSIKNSQVVVAHTFNLSTGETEAGGSL